MASDIALRNLLSEVRACRHCKKVLPQSPRPVLRLTPSARLLIIGQAPGSKVHASGIPWDDPGGDRLRDWLGLTQEQFYDDTKIAIIPMGLCYPGRGKSGDLPPLSVCAPRWHDRLLAHLPAFELILLVGRYAQNYYLAGNGYTVAKRIQQADWWSAKYLPLVHPSPRNRRWLANNSWFETSLVLVLRARVNGLVSVD
ncbi:MAG: uracil-DNA glycosylase family protein [Gammaproteobacteria bacterium]|nr:MAG: uracil-DNA glycosylase family protein [Gammaproteobacteria bacterium]